MKFCKVFALPLVGASLVSAAFVVAQDKPAQTAQPKPGQTQQQGRPAQAGQRAQWMKGDLTLATCVSIDNQGEIAIAKFAHDKVQHEDVKKFAMLMVEDHQAFQKMLDRFAPEAARESLTEKSPSSQDDSRPTASGKSRVEQAKGTTPAGQPVVQQTAGTEPNGVADAGQPLDFIQLHREIAQECLTASKAGLAKKKGTEMDQCFIGYQIAKHAAMKAKLTVLQRHASSELAQVFGQGIETTEKHMQEAEAIMKKLDASDSKTERREERREERRDNK